MYFSDNFKNFIGIFFPEDDISSEKKEESKKVKNLILVIPEEEAFSYDTKMYISNKWGFGIKIFPVDKFLTDKISEITFLSPEEYYGYRDSLRHKIGKLLKTMGLYTVAKKIETNISRIISPDKD